RIPSWEPQREALLFAERFVEFARSHDADAASTAMKQLLEHTQRAVHNYLDVGVRQRPLPV
ncbi:hypothetical protein, partial [Paenarthrobacter sp. NPDC058040]|uniref:hypothetical protein n=1 Tax=unclassified Paenarthrobacter TaxID=2634190 RepID=UPI0036DF25BD